MHEAARRIINIVTPEETPPVSRPFSLLLIRAQGCKVEYTRMRFQYVLIPRQFTDRPDGRTPLTDKILEPSANSSKGWNATQAD